MSYQTVNLIILSLTAAVVAWQAFETRRAANASRDAIRSNERHLRLLHQQWLETSEFKFEMAASGPRIEFVVANRTKLPLTLKRIVALTNSADVLDATLGVKVLEPDGEHFQLFDFIETDAEDLWRPGERVAMDVVVAVYFIDAFGDNRRMLFGRHVTRQSTGKIFVDRYQRGLEQRWRELAASHPEIALPSGA